MVQGQGFERITTNNRMEMMAAYEALRECYRQGLGDTDLLVHSDSQYLVNGMQTWRYAWRRRGFKGIKNGDLWERLDKASLFFRVTFKWVKGHAGNEWNEKVDALAQAAARRRSARS